MSDLFGNHIVGFPTRRLKCLVKEKTKYQKQSRDYYKSRVNLETTTRVHLQRLTSLTLLSRICELCESTYHNW